nr:MarR family transcriptional regulator [uncultured Methanobrevibacter sp.]
MEEIHQGIIDNSPFIAWIHNISLNQQKYMKTKCKDFDLGHDIRYIMFIHDNPDCSQDDLVNMFGQSKGNIAKVLKKLEDKEFIKRDVNPENRRKYMLKTTDKANKLVPEYRQISKEWEKEVGITDEDKQFKKRIIEIAISGMKLTEDNLRGN